MLTDMTLGQYYPGHSYLHQMDPRAKILCTMIFIVAIFLANNLYSYIVVAGFTFLAIALSGVPAKMIWKAIKPLWVILVFTMLIHILTTPGTEIFSWKFIHISEEGIRNGIVMTLRLVFLIAFHLYHEPDRPDRRHRRPPDAIPSLRGSRARARHDDDHRASFHPDTFGRN